MTYIKKFIILFPTPLFMIMGFFNLFHVNPHMCGGHDGQSFEMTLMWFAMSIAHCKPWLDYID
jgi:hypothetical protein